MPPGRTPKSAAQKKLEGNPGKRKIKTEPQLKPALPEPPATLTDEAVKEWNRVAPELFAAKILTNADRAALAAYCQDWADWVEARGKIIGDNKVVDSPSGYKMQSPWVAIANKAHTNFMRVASEFGLTPASRVRLATEPPESDDEAAKKEKKIFGD